MKTKIIISGIAGRMGSLIAQLASADPEIMLAGGLEQPGQKDYETNLEKIIDNSNVVIDFSTPEATLEHLKTVQQHKKAMVIGTTGFTKQQLQEIDKFSSGIACVLSPNMSIGVNLLFEFAGLLSNRIPKNYDTEIIESHHHNKKDAPSGTAKKLAEIIAQATGRDLEKEAVYGRQGITGPRRPQEIGIHAVRAGDIVGEHTILWAGPGEVIELKHRALSRSAFASGALTAAKFAARANPGKYNMLDVLKNI